MSNEIMKHLQKLKLLCPFREEEILNELRQSKSHCKAVLLVLLDEVDMPSSGGFWIWLKGA